MKCPIGSYTHPNTEMKFQIHPELGACFICPKCGHIENQEDDDGEL